MVALNTSAAIFILGSILYLLLPLHILWRRRVSSRVTSSPAQIPLALYGLVACLWSALQAAGYLGRLDALDPRFLVQAPFYGLVVLAALFLFLELSFLKRSRWEWLGWGAGALWVIGPIFLDANPSGVVREILLGGANWVIPREAAAQAGLVTGWLGFLLAAGAVLRRAPRLVEPDAPPFSAANPRAYWGVGLSLVLGGDGFFFLALRPFGSLLHLAGIGVITYTILSTHQPDIKRVLRRALSYGLVTAVAIVVYAVVAFSVTVLSPASGAWRMGWTVLLLAGILGIVIDPLLHITEREINQWIAGRERTPARILRDYSQSLTNILDSQLLATMAVATASEVMEVQRGFLFLVDFEKDENGQNAYCLHGIRGMGDTDPTFGVLAEDSPLADTFSNQRRPLTKLEIDSQPRFRSAPPGELAWLASLRTDIYVPIFSKTKWIGLLALGPHRNGASYNPGHMEVLSSLADQTSIALENTRLVEGLARLNNQFRRAYTALDQANQHLERLDRTKSDFISIASHELRTPLTLIKGASQMLDEEQVFQENPYYQQLLRKLRTGSERLHTIVDSMLDMAKIDTRDLQLAAQPVLIAGLIDMLQKEFAQSLAERNLSFETEDLASLPAITGDAVALRKAFHHLIVNAIKYTPDGGKITVRGCQIEPGLEELPGGGVEVVVSDTGIGIDPRFKELIFVKFYQTGELVLHSTGKTKFKGGGPGLGLAIAKGIVEAHGGKIWVESPGYDEEKFPGSHFFVRLPLALPARMAVALGS